MKLSEGVGGDSKGCNRLFIFSRWPPFSKWPPLKKNTHVSDLGDGWRDFNENWYSDRMKYPKHFREKKFDANAAILKWRPFYYTHPRKTLILSKFNEISFLVTFLCTDWSGLLF